MYAVSEDFKRAVRRSHKASVRCEIWREGQKLRTLEPLDGSVEIDGRRAVRRTCQVSIAVPDPRVVVNRQTATYARLAAAGYASYSALAAAFPTYATLSLPSAETAGTVDSGLVPQTAFDDVTPYGNEIRLWRGIEITTGRQRNYSNLAAAFATYTALAAGAPTYGQLAQTTIVTTDVEEVPLGVFVITDVDVKAQRGTTNLTVKGSDRSLRVQRNRWAEPYQIATGTNVGTALTALLQDRYDDVQVNFTSTDRTVPSTVLGAETDNDPWADAQRIATAAGLELYFDGDGVARLEPVNDFTEVSPDAIYRENDEAMVLSVSRSVSVQKTYNGVIATAEGTGTTDTFRAEAWDEDADSPTYRYGPFGQVPKFFSSPLLTSQDAALSAATSILAKSRGVVESVDWEQITDPSLDSGDVIAVTNDATKVDRLMVVDRLTIPLKVQDSMKAVARTIRSLSGESFAEEED